MRAQEDDSFLPDESLPPDESLLQDESIIPDESLLPDESSIPDGSPTPGDIRKRVRKKRMTGKMLEWRGAFGWIRPDQAINHEKASMHQGKVYINKKDLSITGQEPLKEGDAVTFIVYADVDGLGAWDLRLRSEEIAAQEAEVKRRKMEKKVKDEAKRINSFTSDGSFLEQCKRLQAQEAADKAMKELATLIPGNANAAESAANSRGSSENLDSGGSLASSKGPQPFLISKGSVGFAGKTGIAATFGTIQKGKLAAPGKGNFGIHAKGSEQVISSGSMKGSNVRPAAITPKGVLGGQSSVGNGWGGAGVKGAGKYPAPASYGKGPSFAGGASNTPQINSWQGKWDGQRNGSFDNSSSDNSWDSSWDNSWDSSWSSNWNKGCSGKWMAGGKPGVGASSSFKGAWKSTGKGIVGKDLVEP